jgi:hypothetical protein
MPEEVLREKSCASESPGGRLGICSGGFLTDHQRINPSPLPDQMKCRPRFQCE